MRGKPNPMLKIGQADHGNRAGEDLYALREVRYTQAPHLGMLTPQFNLPLPKISPMSE